MSVSKIGKSATRGAINIFTGKIISRIIGIIFGIITVRILGPENYGLLLITVTAPNILILISDFGINTAVTKFMSEARAKNETNQLRYILYSGFIFKALLCGSLSVICFAGAEFFASAFAKTSIAPLIQISSPLILAWTLSDFSDSVLLALDLTQYNAIFMILSETLISVLPILLMITFTAKAYYALAGMVIATLTIVFLQLIFCFRQVLKISKDHNGTNILNGIRQALKKSLIYGIPLQAIIFIDSGLGQFQKFMVARFGTPFEVGNYGVAQSGNNFVDYLAWPVSVVIFPMFSKVDPKKQNEGLKKLFHYSLKFSTLVILPAALTIFLLGKPLLTIMFGQEYEFAWNYLLLLSISWLTYGLGNVHLRKLLLAQGDTRFLTINDLITAAVNISLALVLVPLYGIFGLIITNLLAGWPSYVLKYRRAGQLYKIYFPTKELLRIYISTILTALATFPIIWLLKNDFLKLILGLISIVAIYLISLILTRAITVDDIQILRGMIREFYIYKFIKVVLDFMEKIIQILKLEC
jgi:O-antigen/teichoic acid export membrane protein